MDVRSTKTVKSARRVTKKEKKKVTQTISVKYNLKEDLPKIKNDLVIYQVSKNKLRHFTEFVFQVYAKDYRKKYGWKASRKDLDVMIQEDLAYADSSVFIAMKNLTGRILGSIRISQKTREDIVFPIEKDFGIDLKELYPAQGTKPHEIWHGGRLAIDQAALEEEGITMNAIKMIRTLLGYAAKIVSRHPANILVCEVDQILYKLMRALGLNARIVGEGKQYLGSMTYPVMITGQALREWK